MILRILGIDPGLATVGFSIVDSDKKIMKLVTCGVISTPAHTSLSSRLDRIFCDMNELISTSLYLFKDCKNTIFPTKRQTPGPIAGRAG